MDGWRTDGWEGKQRIESNLTIRNPPTSPSQPLLFGTAVDELHTGKHSKLCRNLLMIVKKN